LKNRLTSNPSSSDYEAPPARDHVPGPTTPEARVPGSIYA
jgi:hypothetical protein